MPRIHFQQQLAELKDKLLAMAALSQQAVESAVDAYLQHDQGLCQYVRQNETAINTAQRELDEMAYVLLSREQPMAIDLREIVSAMRVATDLERIGDLAKNIAKRVMVLDSDLNLAQVLRGVDHMTDLVLTQIKDVLDAYAHRDADKALAVWRGDEEVDAVNNSLFRELLTYMIEDPRNISVCIHLLFCAKNIERIGDHATNIAETVHYMVEGRALPDERPKGDFTSSTNVPFRS